MTPRTAVVTGAAGTIGLGSVIKLLEQDRRVVMVDKDAQRLEQIAAQFNQEQVLTIAADLADASTPKMISQAIATKGWQPTQILVNNAGISIKHDGKAHDALSMQAQEWEQIMEINVTAPLRLAQQFLPYMLEQKWGRIVNISSRAGRYNPNQAGPAYVTSKAAILGLTRSLANDFSKHGVTTNAIAPGFVESQMTGQLLPEQLTSLVQRTPVGRGGTGQELGSAVAYLASEDAGFITGTCLDVNGGQNMA